MLYVLMIWTKNWWEWRSWLSSGPEMSFNPATICLRQGLLSTKAAGRNGLCLVILGFLLLLWVMRPPGPADSSFLEQWFPRRVHHTAFGVQGFCGGLCFLGILPPMVSVLRWLNVWWWLRPSDYGVVKKCILQALQLGCLGNVQPVESIRLWNFTSLVQLHLSRRCSLERQGVPPCQVAWVMAGREWQKRRDSFVGQIGLQISLREGEGCPGLGALPSFVDQQAFIPRPACVKITLKPMY